ncbi:hypothetical protein BpHYR1_047268 [Brachionus plicatilis]|uniref:Uncharacterized protein n=1 Tax=Brachionus plicatilis TaxID=10195 RepID=A0A3M7T5D5_BRAPC|nr:hypothetical protein BpHYR1_047268 [Brachionus plicatilis]
MIQDSSLTHQNSTGPLNVQIFRSTQANIEPSIQTQSATTSNQILSIGGNNQLLENQNDQTAKLFFLYLKMYKNNLYPFF